MVVSRTADVTESRTGSRSTEGQLGKRIAAFILDNIIAGALFWGILVMTFFGAIASSTLVSEAFVGPYFVLMLALGVLALFAYYIVLETTYGQTPGKMLVDIQVVDGNGETPSLRASTKRNVTRLPAMIMPLVFSLCALVVLLATDDEQRLGDLLADTYVVSEHR